MSRENGPPVSGAAMKGFWLVLFLVLLCLQGIQVKAMKMSLVHQEKEMEVEAHSSRGIDNWDECRDAQDRYLSLRGDLLP